MNYMIWFGIIFCITQSAMFSGLNLACFSITKLQLEIESNRNNPQALKVARLRQDSNFLLTTILWGKCGYQRFTHLALKLCDGRGNRLRFFHGHYHFFG